MKSVPLYHVEYVLKLGDRWTPHVLAIRDPSEAETERKRRDGDKLYACVRVTGPHEHMVPDNG